MNCYVYKGSRHDDHFLFLPEKLADKEGRSEPDNVPPPLLQMLGELAFVVEFELHPKKKLPQADAAQVIADIYTQGFYLQMPKRDLRAEEDRIFN